MTHAGGGVGEAEGEGGLGVGEALEVAEEEDLAVVVVELVEGEAEAAFELAAEAVGGGGEAGVAEAVGEVEARAVGELGRGQRSLAVEGSPGGDPVAAVLVNHPVARDLAEPEVERHGRVAEVIGQAAARLDQDVLHDVARVDPAADRVVEPEVDHPPQRFAVPLPEPIGRGKGRRRREAVEQDAGRVGVGPHRDGVAGGSVVAGSILLAATARKEPG